MLSICTTIKNRSRVPSDKGILNLFPNCIKSLAKSLTLDTDVELVIADWKSDDWPILDWIEDAIPNIPIHLVTIEADGFSAGAGRNVAANNSDGDILFFMDADMLVNKEVIDYGILQASQGNVYYPTVRYEIDGGKHIIHEGGGNLFISKDLYKNSGGWPEYHEHGFEDTDYAAVLKKLANISINDNISIFHQWHPQTKLFKNQFSNGDEKVEERREFYQNKVNETPKKMVQALDYVFSHNPNTTHQNLNRPAREERRYV